MIKSFIDFGIKHKETIKKCIPKWLINMALSITQKKYSPPKLRGGFVDGLFPDGMNISGYINSPIGVGQGCRLLARAASASGYPVALTDVRGNSSDKGSFMPELNIGESRYSINIIHVNPREYPSDISKFPEHFWRKHYNIGVWLWELEEFPDIWLKYFNFVDEVWTPSEFNTSAIRAKAPVPVYTVPYGISAEYDSALSRGFFNLPEDRFLFLAMYDSNSSSSRKNPDGAIEAYKTAFPEESHATGLVLKTNNASSHDIEILKDKTGGRKDMFFINRTLSKKEVNSLIRLSDVFVSMHRSEGFGLVMAEAMYLGTPCIATGWSANTDFMNNENSCLVDFKFVDVNDREIYLPVFEGRFIPRWAEPDIIQAAGFMRKLADDSDFYASVSKKAEFSIKTDFSIENSALRIKSRIDSILGR